MLQAFRTHKRWMMFIASFFIVPSFIVTGVYSYNRMIQNDEQIAEIGGEGISPADFDNAKRRFLDAARREQGSQFNAAAYDTKEARAVILESLLNERALALEIANSHVQISEAEAVNLVKHAGVFQRNGKFSSEAYQNYLHAIGKSDAIFVAELRRDMAREVLTGAITRSSLESEFGAKILWDVMKEERTVRYAKVESKDFLKTSAPTDKEVRDFYDAHPDAFKVPENVDIEYVTLSPASYTDISVNVDEMKTFYEQNIARFTTPETRRASHILIAGDTEEAQKKAQNLAATLKKTPSRFAALAKTNSEDPGSAKQGGDLGFFGRGQMVAEFEKAVFENKKGTVVGPVKTQFGYHIIYVTDIRPSSVKSFNQARAEIETLYKNNQALQLFANDAETFSNMVYEQSESLTPVIEKFRLKTTQVKGVTRNFTNELITPQVVEALYSYDVLNDKRNTSALEVGSNTLLAARVVAYHPESIETFEAVKADIKTILTQQNAVMKARKVAEDRLADLEKGKTASVKFGRAVTVSRQAPNGLTPAVVNALMLAKVPSKVSAQGDLDFYIVDVMSSKLPKTDPDELAGLKSQLMSLYMPSESRAYLASLRAKYDAKVLNKDYELP